MNEETYLIWSNEHGAWWRPDANGYTDQLAEAGRYRKDRAEWTVANAGAYGPNGEPNEVMVLAPEHSWHGRR